MADRSAMVLRSGRSVAMARRANMARLTLVDVKWALVELRRFIDVTTLFQPPPTPGIVFFGDDRHPKGPASEIVAAAQVVEQILNRVLPDWRESIPRVKDNRWQQERQAAQRAVAQLERAAEVSEKLGDNAPRLNAGLMHPWVWEGARSLWQSGYLRDAVRAASVKVNAEVQNKLARRDIAETTLFQQAYSKEEPAQGSPRLRVPEDDGGKTALSVRRGIAALAEGCYAALRNPSSHDILDELPEIEALEQLAAFSLLARFVDRSSVLR